MKHLHITGCPRSGTTLLVEMVRACFRCDGSSEHETSVLNPIPEYASIWITKHPNEIDLVARLMPLNKSLHAIYIERDPRSVITSVHAAAPGCYATNYKTWSECHRVAVALKRVNNFFYLCYEELVSEPEKIQVQLMRAFPWLEKKESFSNYHHYARSSKEAVSAMNGLRQISTNSVATWRTHLPRVKEELIRHPEMLDDLVECGYELNDSWAKILQDVPFVEHPVWKEVAPSILKRFDRWQRRQRKIKKFIKNARRKNLS